MAEENDYELLTKNCQRLLLKIIIPEPRERKNGVKYCFFD